MSFKEAFNVSSKVEKGKKKTEMKVDVNAFAEGGMLEEKSAELIGDIQKNIDYMKKLIGKDLNADETKIAWLAIERELEMNIPNNVSSVMSEKAISHSEAVNQVLGNILLKVEDYVRGRLKTVIKTVDNESWMGNVSKSEAGDILKALEKSRDPNSHLTKEAVQAFQDRYANPNAFDQGVRVMMAGGRSTSTDRADRAMHAK